MEKTCTRCGDEKPLDGFSPDKARTDGRSSWCKDCYAEHRRAKRRGEKPPPLPKPTASQRFDAFLIDVPFTGCRIFMGNISSTSGYGRFKVNGKTVSAHRFAYWRHFGVIPKPEIHHECNNPLCCEPSHLRAVTKAEHEAIHAAD